MSDPKNETVWITIPDEATPAPETPAIPDKSVSRAVAPSGDKVRNKAFWGVSFAVLVIFVLMLLAPQQFANLLQGNLFDGDFQVVPDYEEQNTGALFGDEEEGGDDVASETPEDETVVEAESEAVSIQIEPVTDTETTSENTSDSPESEEADDTSEQDDGEAVTTDMESDDDTGSEAESGEMRPAAEDGQSESDISIDAEAVEIDLETGEVTGDDAQSGDPLTGSDGTSDESGSGSDLIQSLSQQLNDMKEESRRNEQMIQDLMQMLEDQAAGVHSSGGQTGTALPAGTDTAAQLGSGIGLGGTGAVSGGVNAQTAGTYRYNTHTVTVSPYDILAQNKSAVTQPASYQANVTYAPSVQPTSNQTAYNPALAQVQGQPGTGPTEAILFAFAIASLGVLVWGIMRAARA